MSRKERKQRMAKVRTTIDKTILDSLDILVSNKGSVNGGDVADNIQRSVKKLLHSGSLIASFMPNNQYRDLVLSKASYIVEQFNIQFSKN